MIKQNCILTWVFLFLAAIALNMDYPLYSIVLVAITTVYHESGRIMDKLNNIKEEQ